jgi:thioredoxin reductase (NADPH)
MPEPTTITTDTLIVGSGPTGLFQVFQLGLLEIKAHVIDALPYAGGQCIELYPDKPIYDIPALPRCTGRELVSRLLEQISPFQTTFHLGQEVTSVEPQADKRFLVQTSTGQRFLTKTIFIAGGVGSFQPRELSLEDFKKFRGTQIHYTVPSDSAHWIKQNVLVVGANDAALEFAIQQVQLGNPKVTLLHRRDQFQAQENTLIEIDRLRQTHQLAFLAGQITGFQTHHDQLSAVLITNTQGSTQPLKVDHIAAFLGLSPKLGPISQWGLNLDKRQIVVDTEKFETNISGIFAVGDINTYPGKKKLILCGFHEATLAAFAAAAHITPDKATPLQYTTTSKKLHQLLGVTSN